MDHKSKLEEKKSSKSKVAKKESKKPIEFIVHINGHRYDFVVER